MVSLQMVILNELLFFPEETDIGRNWVGREEMFFREFLFMTKIDKSLFYLCFKL